MWVRSYSNMCQFYQEKNRKVELQGIGYNIDHLVISHYLKSYDYLQIKGNLVFLSLFGTFLRRFSLLLKLMRPLRIYLAISSVIWLEEPLFSDNYIAAEKPDKSTGFFGNLPQFFIYLIRRIYASTPSAIMDLRRENEVSLEVVLIWYHRRKKISDTKWCIIQNG